MSVLDALFATVAPLECTVCNREDYLLCPDCTIELGPHPPSRCFRCFSPTKNFKTCPQCALTCDAFSVKPVYAYTKLAKKVVHDFKFNGKRAAAKDLAQLMAPSTASLSRQTMIVHIPTATSRVRLRGYDHAKLLAKSLSHNTGLLHFALLTRSTQGRQVGLSKAQRNLNMIDAFRIVNAGLVKGADILLVDDVATTGATLTEAAKVLKQAGAHRVDALVFAQALK